MTLKIYCQPRMTAFLPFLFKSTAIGTSLSFVLAEIKEDLALTMKLKRRLQLSLRRNTSPFREHCTYEHLHFTLTYLVPSLKKQLQVERDGLGFEKKVANDLMCD